MVKIERSGVNNVIRGVEIGDMVLIKNSPYFIAYCNAGGECLLIHLSDGNRWKDETFEEGISEMELLKYIDDPDATIELIKKNQYEMTINIK